jgi:hypothetical protein
MAVPLRPLATASRNCCSLPGQRRS